MVPRLRSAGPIPLLVLLLGASAALEAQWRPATTVDPGSLDEVPAAVRENEEGFRLTVYRSPGDTRILGSFHLPPRDADLLDASRPPSVRIDGGAQQALLRLSGELKSVGFLFYGGEGQPIDGVLRQLMNGELATFEYPLHGGGFKSTDFGLAGAAPVIAEVLGIPEVVTESLRALVRGREEEGQRCLAMSKRKARDECLADLRRCLQEEPATLEALRSCLASAP